MAGIPSAAGLVVAAGVGGAASVALEPAFEIPRQEAWLRNQNRVLEPGILARLVAQGGIELGDAQDEANRQGYSNDKLDRLIYAAQNVPGTAELLFLWRLGLIDQATWTEGMVKLGQRPDFIDYVAQTFSVPVTAEQAAILVQRSVIENQGQLPFSTDIPPGNVPRMPKVNLDAYASAQAYGVGKDQLDALTRIIGLPASPDLAARMTFREIITRDDFTSAIAEGNTRQEWADALFEGFRQILTAHDYAELELRGFLSREERLAGTGKHGMSDEDSDLLFDVLGRAPAVRAITTGLARGGVYNGPTDAIPPVFLSSIERSNTRPEFYDIAYANRYTYPSAFVIRALLEAGVWTADRAEEVLLEIGWPPDMAKEVATFYAPKGTTIADKHVSKAQGQLWTTTHTSYKSGEISDATATDALTTAGVDPNAITAVLDVWRSERELIRKQLSASEVKKAYKGGVTNPATGLAWTEVDATNRLLELGYSTADAATLLEL